MTTAHVREADLAEISHCACLHVRRAARVLTRTYDAALAPAELTIGQFGLLARLYGRRESRDGVSIAELAALVDVDPTTVNRLLKPLERDGLVVAGRVVADRRVRNVRISRSGIARLRRAIPHWKSAQREALASLGSGAPRLTALLDTLAAEREPAR